jgi:O-antigen/teichoic acid export membrane protein
LAAVILISILLVKSGYDTLGVSRYERFLFLANLFSFFWAMGIKNAALSYHASLSKNHQSGFFFNALVLLQSAGLGFGLIAYFLSGFHLFTAGDFDFNDKLILCLYIILYAPTILAEVIFIIHKKSGILIRYGIFIHGLQLIIIGGGALLDLDISLIIRLLLIVITIRWMYTLYVVFKNSETLFSGKAVKNFSWFALPVIGHMLLSNGMEFIDGLLVNRFFNPENFAVFRYGARELPFILILISSVVSTAIPAAVKSFDLSAKSVKKHTLRLMHIFYPASIVLIWISPFLFSTFYSEEYLQSAAIFNIYLLILASRIFLPEVFLYGKHENRVLMYFSLIELVLNLSLSLVLLKIHGLQGIAAATVIAYISSKIMMGAFMWFKYGLHPSKYLHLPYYVVYTVLLISSFFFAAAL